MKNAVVLGGGITGMRIAAYLAEKGYKITVLEKSPKIGGMTSSFKYKDFTLDYGPHKFYTQLPGVYDDFKHVVGKDNYIIVKKKNSIRLLGKYFDFPVSITQLVFNINPFLASKIMLDFIKAKLRKKEVISYEDYFINGFGKMGYSILFKGFAEKVWSNPKTLSEELARRRSPASSIIDVLKTALLKNEKNVSAEYFYYPKNGYGVMCDKLAESILSRGGKIILNALPQKINFVKGKPKSVEFIAGKNKKKKIDCDMVVSTISVTDLPDLISPAPKNEIFRAAKKLKFRSLIIAYVFLKKEKALKDNWIFFPEKEFCFNRVAEQKSFSPDTCPEDKTVLTAEITCNFGDELYNAPEEKIKEMVLNDLEKAGLIKKGEVYDFFTRKAGRVYPVYEIGYKDNLNAILDYLDSLQDIYTVGRLGLFNYNNADHCLDMAKVTSSIIIENKSREEWKKARDYFDNYRIVD